MITQFISQVTKAMEVLYEDTCVVIEYRKVRDEITKRTSIEEDKVIVDQPCKLSFKSIVSTKENGEVATVKQVVKLLISSDININPGSKIVVIHKGKTTAYKNSGKPAIYSAHQEVILELFEDRA